jgi:UDP-N-acetylmuramoyl-tripeptide--D-alanyl-D-alanine ligase
VTLLWTTDDLIAAMGGRPFGNLPEGITGVSIDTRTLKPGEAFFAIRGDRFDGHDFATHAMAAGASVIVVSEERLPALGRLAIAKIVVPDVLRALEKLAVAARARSRARIVAVTGSAGKTTTKEMLRTALQVAGPVHAAEGSFNNHWGVPLTLARLPLDARYGVFEIGMNHAGEIEPLVKMVQPHVAVVTMVAGAHLGHFSSLEDIARAKAEIFSGLVPGGQAIINRDDPRWNLLAKMAMDMGVENVWGFGENPRAQFRLVSWEPDDTGSTITVRIAGQEITGRIGAPGRHMVQNALAVLGAGYLVGADVPEMLNALAMFQPAEGRGRRYRLRHPDGGDFTVIDESYNANPASMRAALQLLSAAPVPEGGRRIAVLGDMLELGEHSARLHEALGELVSQAKADLLLIAGDEMKALAAKPPADVHVEYRETAADLEPILLQTVRPGDTIVVKSSKSAGFSKLVKALLAHFPPVDAADDA